MRLRLKVLWLRTIIVLALMALPLLAQAQMEARNMVITKAGQLRGIPHQGVIAFKGIPFAAPPTGDYRWRAPQPVAPWPGIRRADHFGPNCMQKPMPSDAAPLGVTPAEDCLYLNVWAPSDAIPDPNAHVSGNAKPVMVWIHGGGYVNGGASSAIYDGTAFAQDDVILVSFNYRLGRFGFFAHPALSAETQAEHKDARYLDRTLGNYGVMDQLAALAWVKRNIVAFGGDPNNVTLFGESAGGSSVLDLTGSPAAHDLFQRVAVMSGGGQPVWRYRFSHVAEPMRDQWPGAIHASELPYLFRTLDVRYGHVSDADRAGAWQLHRYFVNFARTGNPNGEGAPVWPVHTPLSALIMDFTAFNGPVARQDPWQARLDLVEQHLTPALN